MRPVGHSIPPAFMQSFEQPIRCWNGNWQLVFWERLGGGGVVFSRWEGTVTWSGNVYPTYVSMSLKVWSPGTSEKPAGAELCWNVFCRASMFFHYFKIPVALDRNCSAFFQYWEDGVVRLFGVIFHCFYFIFIFFSALHVLGCCSSTSFLELPCFLVRQSISVLLSESQSIDFKASHLKARSTSTSSLYLLHLIVSWFKFNLNL